MYQQDPRSLPDPRRVSDKLRDSLIDRPLNEDEELVADRLWEVILDIKCLLEVMKDSVPVDADEFTSETSYVTVAAVKLATYTAAWGASLQMFQFLASKASQSVVYRSRAQLAPASDRRQAHLWYAKGAEESARTAANINHDTWVATFHNIRLHQLRELLREKLNELRLLRAEYQQRVDEGLLPEYTEDDLKD